MVSLTWFIRIGLALLLGVSAVQKIRLPQEIQQFLQRLGISAYLSKVVRVGVITGECMTVVLLLTGPTLLAGLAVSFLFLAFTLALVRSAGVAGPRVCCGCFGERVARGGLPRQVVSRAVGVVAGIVVVLGGSDTGFAVAEALLFLGVVGLVSGVVIPHLTSRRKEGVFRRSEGTALSPGRQRLGRRLFLRRMLLVGGGAAAGTALTPLAVSFACTVCGDGMVAQSAAAEGGGSDRSTCMVLANEQRLACDSQISDEFEAGYLDADGDDERQLLFADTFRQRLIKCNDTFQQSAAAC